jgi:DNA polymerase III delta subunit
MNESILDDNLEIKTSSSFLLSMLLFFNTVFIWLNLKSAGNLPYDDNYGTLLLSLIASLLGCILIIYYCFKKRKIILKNWVIVIGFLISSSPISIFYACYYYEEIFGMTLAN